MNTNINNEENLNEVTGGKPYDPDPRQGVKCPRCGTFVEVSYIEALYGRKIICKNCGLEIKIDPRR